MVVCLCTGTTDRAITQLARQGVCSVDEIVQRTGAGRFCAPCRGAIAEVLKRSSDDRAPSTAGR